MDSIVFCTYKHNLIFLQETAVETTKHRGAKREKHHRPKPEVLMNLIKGLSPIIRYQYKNVLNIMAKGLS
jgi:hypothetical protein